MSTWLLSEVILRIQPEIAPETYSVTFFREISPEMDAGIASGIASGFPLFKTPSLSLISPRMISSISTESHTFILESLQDLLLESI